MQAESPTELRVRRRDLPVQRASAKRERQLERAFDLLAPVYEEIGELGVLVEEPETAPWLVRIALAQGDQRRAVVVGAMKGQRTTTARFPRLRHRPATRPVRERCRRARARGREHVRPLGASVSGGAGVVKRW
jgi:hypothetical protein